MPMEVPRRDLRKIPMPQWPARSMSAKQSGPWAVFFQGEDDRPLVNPESLTTAEYLTNPKTQRLASTTKFAHSLPRPKTAPGALPERDFVDSYTLERLRREREKEQQTLFVGFVSPRSASSALPSHGPLEFDVVRVLSQRSLTAQLLTCPRAQPRPSFGRSAATASPCSGILGSGAACPGSGGMTGCKLVFSLLSPKIGSVYWISLTIQGEILAERPTEMVRCQVHAMEEDQAALAKCPGAIGLNRSPNDLSVAFSSRRCHLHCRGKPSALFFHRQGIRQSNIRAHIWAALRQSKKVSNMGLSRRCFHFHPHSG
jgi:hypothetical protein